MARRPKTPLTPERERELFLRGLRLFNEGDFFEAHEVWEDAWWPAEGERRLFYQALIQTAVGIEQFRRRNPAGAVLLYRRALEKFARLADSYLGVDCRQVVEDFTHLMQPLLDRAPNARYEVRLNRERLFTIELADRGLNPAGAEDDRRDSGHG